MVHHIVQQVNLLPGLCISLFTKILRRYFIVNAIALLCFISDKSDSERKHDFARFRRRNATYLLRHEIIN